MWLTNSILWVMLEANCSQTKPTGGLDSACRYCRLCFFNVCFDTELKLFPGFLCSLVPVLQPLLLFKSPLGSWDNSLVLMTPLDLRCNGHNFCGLAPGWLRSLLQCGPRVATSPLQCDLKLGECRDDAFVPVLLWPRPHGPHAVVQTMQCIRLLHHPLVSSQICAQPKSSDVFLQ